MFSYRNSIFKNLRSTLINSGLGSEVLVSAAIWIINGIFVAGGDGTSLLRHRHLATENSGGLVTHPLSASSNKYLTLWPAEDSHVCSYIYEITTRADG